MDNLMVEYLSKMKFGELQQYGEMTIFPVFNNAVGNIPYITLKEAMEKELLEITEINASGAVPELKVTNHAEIPVLILDGEELMGAKQNRVVNTTILLKENFETIIPVSCVEQGRWSYKSEKFKDSDRIASYQIRNIKSASVKRSVENSGRYSSNQGAVWDEVHKLQDKMNIHSPTSAMADVYEAKTNDLNEYIKAFEMVEGQNGILVFINSEIMGLDVISNTSAYKDLHKKLIKSYAIDSMVHNQEKINSDIKVDYAHNFINEILKCDESKNESVGYGFDYRFANDTYIGSSLIYDDELIHASFFKSLEVEDHDVGGMSRYSTRAHLRQ